MSEIAGDRVNELSVTYIQNYSNHTAITYSVKDSSWLIIYTRMLGLLTPQILSTFLYHNLHISVPESITEAILAYPDTIADGKDVTVVFAY